MTIIRKHAPTPPTGVRGPTVTMIASRLNPGYVYIMAARNGGLKIGASIDPERRKQTINRGKRIDAEIIYTRAFNYHVVAERAAQAELRAWRLSGEWFGCTPDVAIALIDQLVEVTP